MKLFLGIFIIFTSCTEIFKTELPPIVDCTNDIDFCNYSTSIQPIFDAYCTVCHNSFNVLNLLSYDNMMAYDTLNVDLIIPFNHLNSTLWQQIYTGDMPKNQPLLEDNLILMIKKWIDEGANEL